MDWIEIEIETSNEYIEDICSRLYALDVKGLEIVDPCDFESFLSDNKMLWDYVDKELEDKIKNSKTLVKAYVGDNAQGRQMLEDIEKSIGEMKVDNIKINTKIKKEESWEDNWKQYYHQFTIGDVLILPLWEEPKEGDYKTIFKVDPGMTFGTGTHATTRLCIEQIQKYVSADCDILDLGCGSGILFIIGLLLGAKRAVAVDIDENAKKVSAQNADNNGIDKSKYEVYQGNIVSDGNLRKKLKAKYKLITANIVADVIIAVLPFVKDFLDKDGVFVCSGIIGERADEVEKRLVENGYKIISKSTSEDWVCFAANI